MQWLKQKIFKLLEVFIRQTQDQVILSEKLIYILRIQTYLLSLSYIFENKEISYLSVFTIFARPQIFLPNSEVYAYIILALCLLWILQGSGFINFKFILIFPTLMKSGILNFYFEISRGQIQIIPQTFIILISFFSFIIQDGTNNINLINFDKIQIKTFDYLITFLNYLQMILYSYSQNQLYNDICTLLNILFQIFQLCVYYPPFSNQQKSLFLTIQLYSIYLWLNIVSNFQKNALAEIIAFPFIYSIILTAFKSKFYLQFSIQSKKKNGYSVKFIIQNIKELKLIQNLEIQTPKSNEKKIIYASILLQKNQNFKAFSLLKSLNKKKSLIQTIKIKHMIQQCLNQMANNSDSESFGCKSISQIAEWIISSENSNMKIQEKVIQLIQLKIECFNLLLLYRTNKNYDLLITYIKELINLQKTLELWYEKYPSEKTQSILGFFYSEIMNDYFSAHELKSVAAISDEKMRRITINQDIFSNKMIYLLTQFDGKMKITLTSNDSVGLLEFTNEELYQKNIDILVPPGIAEFHDELVLRWFETGISKYMKQINPNFLFSINQNHFTDVDFATDVSFSMDLKFIVFIQPQQNQQMMIILDKKRKIKSFSKALLDNVGLKNQKSYIEQKIEKVLPGFPKIISQDQIVENAVACFQLTDESQDQSMFNQYNTQYQIILRKFNDEVQYIFIKFLFFKSLFQSQLESSQSSSVISSKEQIKDDCIEINGIQYQVGNESQVEIPIDENNERKNRGLLEINVFAIDGIFSENSNYINEGKNELTNFQGQHKLSEELLIEQKFYSNHIPIPSKLSNFVISKNNKSQKEKEDYIINFPFHDGQSSYVSSMHGLKKSRFYKKYVIIQKIKLQESNTRDHKLFIVFLVLCLLFHIIIQSLQTSQISQNFEKLVSDVDLIQIKNLIYQPFESFLLTRWALNEINTLFGNNLMSETLYKELAQFPKLNLNLGFDQLNENLKQVLNRFEIQSFLEDTYTEIFVYTSTGVGEVYNISLRNSIQILLSYQYDFKMRYAIEGSIVSDSPYVYFSYRNYISIKNQFTSLNEFVLQNTIIKSQQEADQLKSIFVISLTEVALFLAIALHFFYVTKSKINKFFTLFKLVDQENIQQEINKMKLLIQKINKDSNCLYQYKINIETKEKDLQNQTCINSQKRIILKVSYFKQFFFYYVFFIFLLLSIFGNAILTYITSNDYLDKYPFSVELYKQVSDVGTDVPTMYAQRQTLYRVSYIAPFLTNDYVQQIFQEVNNSLIRTQNFNLVQITFDNLLVSQSFKNYFSSIQNQNLCDFLPDFLKDRSERLCPTVMDQSLQRGLITTLQYICNFIQTDMQLSNFTNYTTYSYTDLEGAFLVSNVIAVINSRFHADFLDLTSQFIEQITIHNIIILILCFCMILFSFVKVKEKLIFQLFLAQRLGYLLPIKAFIYNDSIERNLRFLLFEGLYQT